MPAPVVRSTFVSPVLVGRDRLLRQADDAVAAARSGRGQLVLLAGEAGIGKTRLLGAIARRAGLAGLSRAAGAAFPGDLEFAGGVLIDLARNLGHGTDEDGQAELGRRLESRLLSRTDDGPSDDGDRHRRRRLLVLDLADLLAALAGPGPAVLMLEDLHWADDLSLEVVGQLARRLPDLPLLVVGTYRSDELYPRIPMRDWRTRLLTARLAVEATLDRLAPGETATMASALLGRDLPVPADLLAAIQARSDGIPLHVEEFLAALGPGAAAERGDRLLARQVPDTLAAAIVGRADRLTPGARRVAEAAAVVGREFDVRLLVDVTGLADAAVEVGVAELVDRHFVQRLDGGRRFDFRHALIRDALRDSIATGAADLHQRIAEAVLDRPEIGGEAFLSMHFAGAGMAAEAHRFARAAGDRAAAMSAHREAVELYGRAVAFMPPAADPIERARVLAAYAAEATAIDDNTTADEAYAAARRLLADAGDALGAAALLAPHVAVRHLLGDGLEARVSALRAGIDDLDRVGVPESGPARASIEAGLAAAYMLARHLDASIEHGQRARDLAARLGDTAAELNAATTLAAVFVFAGRMAEGWALFDDVIARTTAAGLEAEAARAYRMVGSSASVLVEYDIAERFLREGIDVARRTEHWNHLHYMTSHLAHVAWSTGDWTAARDLAGHALADGRGGITTRITGLHVLGYEALGRGDWIAAEADLTEAREIGEAMAELQRLSPALWGLAELAWLRGDAGTAVALTEAGRAASVEVGDAAYLFPFLVTGTRARLAVGDPLAAGRWVDDVAAELERRAIPGTRPAIDHAAGLLHLAHGATGRARTALETAVDGWARYRRSWEGSWARLDAAKVAARTNRPTEAVRLATEVRATADRLGSAPLVEAADRILDGIGRGRQARDRWAPLTAREFEVARLVAGGRTNPEIATELGITRKTVAAHVEHILARLGADRRTEIAAWVATVGVLDSGPHGADREE